MLSTRPSRFVLSKDGIAHIAALGLNSYSDQAARRLADYFRNKYGHTVEVSNHANIRQVWDMQNVGSAFVLPFQNSGSGLVKEHWKFIKGIHREPAIKIVADINLRIRMCLCGLPDIDPAKARCVISHFQAIRQSSRLVGTSDIGGERSQASVTTPGALLNISEHEATASTAEALRIVRERSDPLFLGLGTEESAREQGLQIYSDDASNLPAERNITQMLLLQRQSIFEDDGFQPELPYHALLLTLKNRRGALRDLLRPIAEKNINITALHKRTMRIDQKEVDFFIELDTSEAEGTERLPASIDALDHVKQTPAWRPTWNSWSDRVLLHPTSFEQRSETIDWASVHNAVSSKYKQYMMVITPRNTPGSLFSLVNVISEQGGDLQTFDSITIGPKEYSYKMRFCVDDPESLRNILNEYERTGLLYEIELVGLE